MTFKTIQRVVDFPLPLGPNSPYTFHLVRVSESLFTAVRLPYFLVRSLSCNNVFDMGLKIKRLT